MSESPVLLVKTHAFGDALLCTSAVRDLVCGVEAEYWVLTGYAAAAVWERFPGIARVFVAPMPPPSSAGGFLSLMRWSIRNRKVMQSVKESFVFQGSPAVRRWVRYLTGSTVRSSGGEPLGKWEKVFPMVETDYAGYSYSKTAGVTPENWRPVFPVRETESEWAANLQLCRPLFAIAPGGGKNPRDTVLEKRWFPDRFAVIADRLSNAGFNIVLVGGSDDSEAAQEMKKLCRADALDMTGKTTWGQTAAILDRCYGFLGADSGIAHLATARGIPSVVLFGPSSPETLFAEGFVNPVRGKVDCSPCYSNSLFPGCIRERAICMDAIETEEVWFTLQKVINENYGS
ncbi:MAG: glycosyltransferase family 9 protein [Candidatus Aegiribacteria sp.]|nr:glycosyltransferase family 9 protein [Candidatus Aegiribacteria sp.]